jgi:O-antigen/teichoic acid export membrane protein
VNLARRAGSAVLWRGLSVTIEKIIFLIRILVLAQFIAPAEFGLVAIAMVSLALMVSLTDFGIVPALIQRPDREKHHLDTAWTMGMVRGAGVNIIMFIAAPYIASAFGQPDATNIIRALAISTMLLAAASIEIATLTRELRFKRLVMIRLAGAICNTAVSILLAKSFGAWAIVWGTVAGAATYMIVSYIAAPYRPRFRVQGATAASLMKFGRWIFMIGIVSVLTDAALRWIITQRIGVTELGLFFMAARLAYLPYQVVTELVSEVAFPLFAQLQKNGTKTAHAFRSLFIGTLALLLPASAILVVLIPDLVEAVLGERWSGAIVVMQLLVIANVAGVAGDTIVPLLKGVGRPKNVFVLDTIQLLVLVPVAWVLVGRHGLAGAGFAMLVTVVISQAFAIRYVAKILDRPFAGTGASCLTIILATLAASLISVLLMNSLSGLMALIVAGFAGAMTTIVVALLLDYFFEIGLLIRITEPFPWLAQFVPQLQSENDIGMNRDDH